MREGTGVLVRLGLCVFRGLVGESGGVGVFVPTGTCGVGVDTECDRVLVGVAVFAARLGAGIGTPMSVLITVTNRATLSIRTTAHTLSRALPFCNSIRPIKSGEHGTGLCQSGIGVRTTSSSCRRSPQRATGV